MDLFDLTGKVAVVSGGSRGIGLMMARGLLEAGASVYISSRKAEAGQAAVAELSRYGVVLSVPDLLREIDKLDRIGVHTFYRPRKWGEGSSSPAWGDAEPVTTVGKTH